mgnify:FL=1
MNQLGLLFQHLALLTMSLPIHLRKYHTLHGVVHTGISLIYAIRKIRLFQKNNDFVEIRNMKNVNEQNFVNELCNQNWDCIYFLVRIQIICGKYGKNSFWKY